jgi:hypothetical protein
MSRVEWSRRTAEEVETVIGIMLCRANPAATRVRPSRGDRGVDIYVPQNGKWTVYQVKSFTGVLTSSRKRQITESWNSFLGLVEERSLEIDAWYLVRPENPTWEDESWLNRLTADAPFPCRWQGLDHCEALAADHQSVIDYYLFDGKQRLQDVLRDFLIAVGSIDTVADLTQPKAAYHGLESIHAAVNAHDPQYRYDFSVDAVVPGELPAIVGSPGLVAAVTRSGSARAVTFRIFARYKEATSDRPVPGRFTLTAEPGSAEAGAVRDFVEYGIPLVHASAAGLEIDLPGGLGGSSDEGMVTIGPARLDASRGTELRLVVLDESGDVELAAVDLVMDPPTTGLDGQRFALSGRERFGVFDLVIKMDTPSRKISLSITSQNLTGSSPADVLAGLYFLTALKPPNKFVLKLRNGPALDEPHQIPQAIADNDDTESIIRVCEALATIQLNTVLPLRVPDLTETTIDEAREWVRVARLLRGDILTITWNRVAVELHEGAKLPGTADDAFTVATKLPLVVRVAGVEVALGSQLAHLAAARIDPADLGHGRPTKVSLIPASDDTGTVRWIGLDSPPGGERPSAG